MDATHLLAALIAIVAPLSTRLVGNDWL